MTLQNFTHKKKTSHWQKAFLQALAIRGNVSEAAKDAGITRPTAYNFRKKSKTFAKKWDNALEEYADLLEATAHKRAVEGVVSPVYYKGEQVDTNLKYSDTLLIFLLKGNRPEKYRERQDVHHSGPSGGPIEFKEVIVSIKQE